MFNVARNFTRRPRKVKIYAHLLSAIAGLSLSAIAHAQTPTGDPSVPILWDLTHRVEKPDTSGLRLIRFITEDDYPPFNFTLPDGTLTGFNVDLGRAICEELQVACTVQARRWDTLIPSLDENRGDAIVASLQINNETRKRVAFTSPYYLTPGRFVTLRSSPLGEAVPEALAGHTIGVVGKSAHSAFLQTFFAKSTIKTFESSQAMRAALRNGEIETLFGDANALSFWLNGTDASGCCAFKGGAFLDPNFFGEGVGIAVRGTNANLRRILDYALAKLAERGVYADLYLKYFPIGAY
ncbi:MAG: transporter substrate-binding domain-containing protein [Methylobacteriaceae bacterium]|nr:transporter substrate-binding domain-containing protein [Methylobacteriaceae bacterium]